MTASRIQPIALERDIRSIGRTILQQTEAASPSILSAEFWQQRTMNWLTKDQDLKRRAFRLVEVMPSLRDAAAIAGHLREYLQPATMDGRASHVPALQLALAYRCNDSLYATLVGNSTRFACSQSARRFIAGSTPEEAIASVRRLRRQGTAFTLDVLGETVIADRVAREHQRRYIDLVHHLCREARTWGELPILDRAPWGRLCRVNISIKLSAIVAKFDPIDPENTIQAVLKRLRPILQAARDGGAFINIDMEHYAVKDLTLEIYKRVLTEPEFKRWPDCGIVIQAYMPEGDGDMTDLIEWARCRGTPITVRLVKGAYWDSEAANAVLNGWPMPLYAEKRQSDAAFERIARLMLQNADIIRPAFASHNVRSIAVVLAMERALGLPRRTLELQMLTGMGEPLKRALVAMNQRVRIYAPFGDLATGMAYLIRRLIENTANESFLQQSFGQNLPAELLLENPEQLGESTQDRMPRPFIQDPDGETDMEPFQNEPGADFSKEENRDAMRQALAEVSGRFGAKHPAIVNGLPVDTPRWHDSLNPSDPSQVVGRTSICDRVVVDKAVFAARAAFDGWSRTPAEDRADILDRAADILRQRRFEIAAWMIYEVGKTWPEAQGDYIETADYLRFYAREMRRLEARPRRRDYPGETNRYVYSPRGVAVVIGPFCFPTALLTGMTAAALVTGNTVVVKPASGATVCAAKMVEILNEAGLPPGVLNFAPGSGADIGDYLVGHPDVDMVAFTGSREVGCRIIEQCRSPSMDGKPFKHVVAEMGGNNAIVIDDDADLDEAVQATIASAFGYSGQKCTTASRAIVLEGVCDTYLNKLTEAANAIRPAAADLPGTTVGPLIDRAAVDRARRCVGEGKKEARCVLENPTTGSRDSGFFFSPVIFADVPPDAQIAREENMAPILCVIRAATFEQALDIANATPYALVGGVYSRSPHNIEHAKRRFDVGMLYINRKITLSRVDRQPFGGFNMSGLGTKTGGPDYLQQFTIPRTISENTLRHGFAPANEPSNLAKSDSKQGDTPSRNPAPSASPA